MHHNWWLLVIPLAASQLSVFFTLVTQRFAPTLPVSTVETTSPLLAAFLCAHLLAAEYRSGIGGVLASKPVDIGKVVLLRLFIVMMLVWGLGFLSLAAFYFGMQPFPVLKPAISCVVSSLFLGLLALTFATMFRHPLAGFGVAAVYWLFDAAPGPPLNHFLSLKSLTASFPTPGVPPGQPLSDVWLAAKLVLFIGAILLYMLHTRLLFTLGSPLTLRRRQRTLAWAGGLLAFYLISGSVVKVVVGYQNRGKLYPDDVAWFRRQFGPYGPVPVSALFGANFRRYLGDIPNTWRLQQDSEGDLLGDTDQHRRSLARILTQAPGSIWAPSAAILMARLGDRAKDSLQDKIAGFQYVIDHYPGSPYEAFALWQIAHNYSDAFDNDPRYEDNARTAYEALLAKYPVTDYNADAYGFLAQSDQRHKNTVAAAEHTRKWIETAPIYEKFRALMLMAEILRDAGKMDEAKTTALQAKKAVQDFRRAKADGRLNLAENKVVRVERDAAEVDQKAQRF
jgi:outer membrane protein assembly factor BamD (BamD/ComL family)